MSAFASKVSRFMEGRNLLRWYVGVQAFFWLGNAWAYQRDIDRLVTVPAFRIVESLAGLQAWIVLATILGLLFVGAAIHPLVSGIRALLVLSVGLKMAFGVALLVAAVSPGGFSYVAMAMADLIVAAMPTTHAYARTRRMYK